MNFEVEITNFEQRSSRMFTDEVRAELEYLVLQDILGPTSVLSMYKVDLKTKERVMLRTCGPELTL